MKIYINRENQKKSGPICKNSVIYIKNPIILLIKIINNCTLSNQCFFFFFILKTIQQNIDRHKA